MFDFVYNYFVLMLTGGSRHVKIAVCRHRNSILMSKSVTIYDDKAWLILKTVLLFLDSKRIDPFYYNT